jgi:cell division protein FtsB
MAYNITRQPQASTTKKLAYLVAIIICLVIIHNLATSTYDLWHKQDLVVSAQNDLAKEKAENSKLQAQLKLVKSDEFLEEQARNELFMVKPGETVAILPANIGSEKKQKEVQLPNWQKWLRIFGINSL